MELNLDFWAKWSTGSGRRRAVRGVQRRRYGLAASDGVDRADGTYTNYSLDLDALAASKGICAGRGLLRAFPAYGYFSQDFYLDDVRIVAGDLAGPRVLSHSPVSLASDGGPLTAVRLTFDEAIAVSSFEADGRDVELKDAAGTAIAPLSVAPVAGSGDTQFDVTFAAQNLRGTYRLKVGPQLTDSSGNPMNQNGNAINGEATDFYSGTVTFAPTVWSPPPVPEPTPRYQVLYDETFENWSPVPTHWAFQTVEDGKIQAVTSGSPRGGTSHLLFDMGTVVGTAGERTQSAILAVDLTGYETATDLNLDFWAKWSTSGYALYVEFSGDGTAWQQVTALTVPNTYTNYSLDLDALAASKGIARDGDFFVRFRAYGYFSQDFYLDDVRIVAGDLAGPRVLSHSPVSLASDGGPLTAVRLTFDEAIAVSSFEADGRDVELKDAAGTAIAPLSVAPVAGSGDTQFDVTFAAQNLRGTYRLKVGPQLTDSSGNPMNQNGNAINGEAADFYSGTVVFAPTVWTGAAVPEPTPRYQVLYEETFENWSTVPTHWAFQTVEDGKIQAVTSGSPRGGTSHLLFDMGTVVGTAGERTQSAILAVDLTGYETATDLNLDFWAKWSTSGYALYVEFSGDGTAWQQVTALTVPNTYTNYSLDLDALAASKGIARDGDFFVRFRAYGYFSHDFYLDDVRVGGGDFMGPRVIGHSPMEPIDGPVTSFDVTFDEPIGDFPLEEARLWGPLGNSILPTSVTSADGLTWTVAFPSQPMAGRYQFIVGPGIRDAYGNLMNQDGDAINGETNGHDDYDGVFHLNFHPVPASYPYYQGFEDVTSLDDHWSFSSGTGGRIQIVDDSGDKVLRIDSTSSSTYATSEATFAVNLAGQTGVKLYWNEYNPADEADSTDGVYVSSDEGLTWFRVDPLSGKNAAWQSRTIDLDAAIQTAEIDYTTDFRIKFQVYTNSSWTSDGRQFDDIRVTWEGAGPKVIEAVVSGAAVAPFTLDGLTFTFDEAINTSTFTLADVLGFTGPGNVDLSDQLIGVSGSGTTFTVHFAEQTAPGAYTMTIGPYIQDLAANPLDQNGNGLVGETVADRFTARTILLQPAPYPYYQGFDGLSGLEDLSANWAFIGNSTHSRIQLADESGDRVLRADSSSTSSSVYVTNEAIFAVDLAGRTGVKLFFQERNQNDPVDAADGVWLSDDRGLTWYRADPLGGTNGNWQNRTVDLDAAIAAGELTYTNNFLIKLQHNGRYGWTSGGRQWDDVRVTWEGDGPKVVGTVISGSGVAPFTLDGLTFTFNEAIDASTFTLADVVSFTGPGGLDLTDELTGVSGSGTSFTVHFAEQTAPGAYTMGIGPYILDLAGNPMDQNGNGFVGETIADRYTARTILLQPAAYPYYQGFDGLSGLDDLSANWVFAGNSANSRIQLVDESGDRVLRADSSSSSSSVYVTNEAIFAIDLAGRSGVKLFFQERNYNDPVDAADGVWLSDDRGITWYRADPLGATNSNWQNRTVDLDAAVAAGALTYTNNFLIKLQHYGRYGWTSGGRQWDDIRVTWEGGGPKVVGTVISGSAAAPFTLDGLTFTFDEALDASTFTLADVVSFTGPGNVDLSAQLTGVSGSGTTFTVHFAEQTAFGAYTMTIGPYILDVAGNPMDQNGNGFVGETIADRYTARTILLQPAAYPYYQGFDGLSGLDDLSANWVFAGNSTNSRIQLVDEAGDRVLRADSASGSSSVYVTNEAVFAVDLAGRSGVKLFFQERNYGDPVDAADGVWLSDDRGLTWYRADSLGGTNSNWQNRTVDLDAAIAAGELTYTNHFLIKLQHNGRYGWTSGGRQWDDVRVTWEGDGPRVLGAAPAAGFSDWPYSLSGFTFTFSEPIDPASFTTVDIVALTGPGGDLKSQVTSITGSGTTYTVNFPEQTTAGRYAIVIGPYILDLAANPLDQDGDGLVGETVADRFTFQLGNRYYVNDASTAHDAWCTQPGDDANDGLSPATPKATVQDVLADYDLEPGDVVRIDTGTYTLASNIVVGSGDGGDNTAAVTFEASPYGVTINRNNLSSGYAWQISTPYTHLTTAASDRHPEVAQRWMVVTGGQIGVYVAADYVTVSRVEASANPYYAVYVAGSSTDHVTIENSVLRGSTNSSSGAGIYVTDADYVTIRNNTIYGNAKYGVYASYSLGNVIENNIIWADGSGDFAVYVSPASSSYLPASDYNDLYATGDAALGYYGSTTPMLSDWRAATGKDLHSVSLDPLFVDPAGGDFHLQSSAGSYHGGAWTADAASSPGIDTGYGEVGAEPAPNQTPLHAAQLGRRNLGAYGGTEQASHTPLERRPWLSVPVGGEVIDAPSLSVTWTWTGQAWQTGDTVMLEFSADSGGTWTAIPGAGAVPADAGTWLWDVSGLPSGPLYRVRLTSNQDSAAQFASPRDFQIRYNGPITYYVNDDSTLDDEWSTQPGNDANDGLTPGTPKATIQAVLDSYDLEPGDLVQVDAGTYYLASDIVLSSLDNGTNGTNVTIRGSWHGTILDRGASGGSAFQVAAPYFTIERFVLRRGNYGVSQPANGYNPVVLQNNVFERNTNYGVYIYRGDFTIVNNTFYEPNAGGIYAGSTALTLQNNVLSVSGNGKSAVYLDNVWADPLVYRHDFDYNDYFPSDGAVLGTYNGTRLDLLSWRAAIGQDSHSFGGDPLFADPAAGDFHLRSQAGRYHPATDTWVVDTVTSPAIDRGTGTVAGEPAPHGGRVNIGAYGNTPQASKSPAYSLLLTSPNGGEMWSGVKTITWSAVGTAWQAGDTVRLEASADGGATWTLIPGAEALAHDAGNFSWDTAAATPNAKPLYRVRAVANQGVEPRPADAGDGWFTLHNQPLVYYVNDGSTVHDQWATAPGDDRHDGLTPATPKATVQAILDTYDLEPGDTVRIDTGYYPTTGIIVTAADQGASGAPVVFEGSPYGVTFDRGDATSGTAAMYVSGAAYVTVRTAAGVAHPDVPQRWMRFTGGYYGLALGGDYNVASCIEASGNFLAGIYVTGSATDHVTIENSLAVGSLSTSGMGVYVYDADYVTIRNTTVAGNGSRGLYFYYSTNIVLENNIVVADGSGDYGVYIGSSSTLSVSDYNDLLATNGALVGYYGAARNNLFAWQSATGKDAYSLSVDPLFADAAGGDYHLRSQGGRYDPATGHWIADPVTSPAIDRGTGVVSGEPAPHGGKVNLGAYGNTPQASKSADYSLLVTSPNGGETWIGRNPVTWSIAGAAWLPADTVRLEYSADDGATWLPIAGAEALPYEAGTFVWDTAYAVRTDLGRYRVRAATNAIAASHAADASDGFFALRAEWPIYTAYMDTDPGWALDAGTAPYRWEWGTPTGSGGDPSSGRTGSYVVGYNLTGPYPNSMSVQYATTSAIDTRGYQDVRLGFWRWLGVQSSTYDHASVQVSADGSTWTTVWDHTGGNLADTAWLYQEFNISAVADHQPTVFVRWSMGPTNSSTTYGGWNLDDMIVMGQPITAAPSAPDLIAASDTGDSNTDDLTRLDNSTPSRALQFQVDGTVPGATVILYADGTPIGSAVAAAASTLVVTDGLTDLADGSRTITAGQQEAGKLASADSPALTITIDSLPPAVTVTAATTSDTAPPLAGTVSEAGLAVLVSVGPGTYAAVNHGDGTWTLSDDFITPPLSAGVYNVVATVVDAAGNRAVDLTVGELTLTGETLANTNPIPGDDAYETNEDTLLTIAAPGLLLNDRDPEGDPLS
jgi:parallel beta-helix repeat protein